MTVSRLALESRPSRSAAALGLLLLLAASGMEYC